MIGEQRSELVLAIRPCSRGFAFVLFEGPLSPIDWGFREARGGDRNARCLDAARVVIAHGQPDVIALADYAASPGKRSERIKRLHSLIANHATGQSIEVCRYTREQIRVCFKGVGAVTRYEIAQTIAAQVHAFGHRLPARRKIWEPEDPRMYLFDAAALVMTHYSVSDRQPS
jgi:hypothetical protein